MVIIFTIYQYRIHLKITQSNIFQSKKEKRRGTSLPVQWWRHHASTEARIWSLIKQLDPTCHTWPKTRGGIFFNKIKQKKFLIKKILKRKSQEPYKEQITISGAERRGKNFRVLVWIPLETDPEARIQKQVIYLQRLGWWNGEGRQTIKGVLSRCWLK